MLDQISLQSRKNRAQLEMAEPIAEVNRANGRSIVRAFKAIKLNRRPAHNAAVQQPTFSAQDEYLRLVALNSALSNATHPK